MSGIKEYAKSKVMYNFIVALDLHIDELEKFVASKST
jgi:hypothetical protein